MHARMHTYTYLMASFPQINLMLALYKLQY